MLIFKFLNDNKAPFRCITPFAFRDSSETSSNIIDSLSYTHRSVNTFTHLWVIDNFRTYIDDPDQVICLQSARFSPPNEETSQTQWQITCYPKGTYGSLSPALVLQLEYVQGERDVKARAHFVVLMDGEGDEDEIEISKDTNYCIYKPGGGNNSRSFTGGTLKHDMLMNLLHRKDRLKILVKISILDETITEPLKYNAVRNQASISEISTRLEQQQPLKLSTDFAKLLQSEQMTDVEILVNPAPPKNPYSLKFERDYEHCEQTTLSFKTHRLILAARSPVFKAMLTSPLEESKRGIIEITDFSASCVENLLNFIYTGRVKDDVTNPMELYRAADKYDVSDLKDNLEIALGTLINVENASEILLLSDLHGSKALKQQALDFIATHTEDVLSSNGWKKFVACSPDLVTDVVRMTASFYP